MKDVEIIKTDPDEVIRIPVGVLLVGKVDGHFEPRPDDDWDSRRVRRTTAPPRIFLCRLVLILVAITAARIVRNAHRRQCTFLRI